MERERGEERRRGKEERKGGERCVLRVVSTLSSPSSSSSRD
jgi:hypothetical protein